MPHVADGTFRWHLGRAIPLRDSIHDLVWWIGSCTDIEEQKRAHERDRNTALALQTAFLPYGLPDVPNAVLDAYYEPAASDMQVGGDWYSAFELPDGRFAIILGDVEGHGLDAALIMARMRELFVAAARERPLSPRSMLRHVNEILTSHDRTVTAFVGLLDPAAMQLSYSLAGHPPAILVDPGGRSTCSPVGDRFPHDDLAIVTIRVA